MVQINIQWIRRIQPNVSENLHNNEYLHTLDSMEIHIYTIIQMNNEITIRLPFKHRSK